MYYTSDLDNIIEYYNDYKKLGMKNEQLFIGIQAGPEDLDQFTTLEATKKIYPK